MVLGGLWSWIGPELLAPTVRLAFILDGNGAWLGSNGARLGPDGFGLGSAHQVSSSGFVVGLSWVKIGSECYARKNLVLSLHALYSIGIALLCFLMTCMSDALPLGTALALLFLTLGCMEPIQSIKTINVTRQG